MDRAATLLAVLDERHASLHQRPLLNGIGPFDANYEGIWYNAIHAVELQRQQLRDELSELQARINEWTPKGAPLESRPIHMESVWLCRSGTRVPYCLRDAPSRPAGDPILTVDAAMVECATCILMFGG